MKLSAPKQITFWVAVVVAVIGLIGSFAAIPVLSGFALWIVVVGFVILAAGNLLENL
jgi:threonine/homoserine/homoserine lactone efflux protein